MCGINGFTFRDPTKIKIMNELTRHRGPDDEGIYIDDQVTLGNLRLAIIDLSPKGHMPMIDRSKRLVITYNGEIYNFLSLRKNLKEKGYAFHSDSDTEVILNLYLEYGEKAFSKLNGMFAIALWDKKEKSLFLVRDRVGIKPLYYTRKKNSLIFSSEIKALRYHTSPSVSKIGLDLYMNLGYVPAPYTMYENILKVIPGELLKWHEGNISKKYFWKARSKDQFKDKTNAKRKLLTTLEDAVNRQLISDRPLGVFLSGGIDSSTVLALATKDRSEPMDTFSIGFSDVPEQEKFNADFYLARQTAKFFNANHHEFFLSPTQALEDFQELVRGLDEPIANPTHIPTYTLAKETRKYVTVLLGGDGGDELFRGYDRYLHAWLLDQYQFLPSALRHQLTDHLLVYKASDKQRISSLLKAQSPAEKYLCFMGQDQSELRKIYSLDNQYLLEILSRLRGFTDSEPFHQTILQIDFNHWLPEESLMRSDKMTMLHSLEQRVPFLDNEVIDIASQIPFSWNVGLKFRKKFLRETVASILPSFIINQPKRGFFSPGAKWLRHPKWQQYLQRTIKTRLLSQFNIDAKGVNHLISQHNQGGYHNNIIWTVLFLAAWAQENTNHHNV